MVDFSKWVKYIGNDDGKHVFYRLGDVDIKNAERKLGYRFPEELSQFYRQVGYGFLCSRDKESIDRMMDPESIANFLVDNTQDEDKYFIEYCKMENLIPFFEVGDGCYITMSIDTNRIFYFEHIIANSLPEFLDKMDANTDYYLQFEMEE